MKHAPKGRIKARPDERQEIDDDPMSAPDPMSTHVGGDTLHGRQRCKAHSKQTKQQCGRTAIDGGTVCRYHGGKAPQVQAKALERLMALQHPAITRLAELIVQREYPSVSIAAVKDALDRTMGKAKEQEQDINVKAEVVVRWSDE